MTPVYPVSVIIPCYCCIETIERAVKSVLNQTYLVSEIILVDDCSPDETLAFINDLVERLNDQRISVLSLVKNAGPGAARNVGWSHATQTWIAFLDADDAWHPRKIEIQWSWLNSHPKVTLCGHATVVSNGDINYSLASIVKANPVSMAQMLISNQFPTRSVMVKRDIPFRFIHDRCEDYFLWLEIIAANFPAWKIHLPLAMSFRKEYSVGGMSSSLWKHEKGEIRALRRLVISGRLNIPAFMLASMWSILKFCRRWLYQYIPIRL
jgi:glycosyltransferase involved in cell wall biosynthesis